MRRVSPLVICTLAIGFGCASQDLGSNIAALREQHDQERARLANLRVQIDVAEREVEQARARASFESCRSELAAVRADMQIFQTQCLEQVATYNRCAANMADKRASTGIWGCLAGIGLSVVTGGAAAGVALAGCAVGKLLGPEDAECGHVPSCVQDADALRRRALEQRGLAEVPLCGGYLGISIDHQIHVLPKARRVTAIGPRTTAFELGLRNGDVIALVEGVDVAERSVLPNVLSKLAPGSPISVTIVREGASYELKGTARNVDFYGKDIREVRLGIKDEDVENIAFVRGVIVQEVTAGSPGHRAGILLGDRIASIDGRPVRRVDDALLSLNEVFPGASTQLVIQREQATLTVTATSTVRWTGAGL